MWVSVCREKNRNNSCCSVYHVLSIFGSHAEGFGKLCLGSRLSFFLFFNCQQEMKEFCRVKINLHAFLMALGGYKQERDVTGPNRGGFFMEALFSFHLLLKPVCFILVNWCNRWFFFFYQNSLETLPDFYQFYWISIRTFSRIQ